MTKIVCPVLGKVFLLCFCNVRPFLAPGRRIKQKGGNMREKIIVILATIAVIAAIGLAGNMDHDEYIEANSTAKPKFIN